MRSNLSNESCIHIWSQLTNKVRNANCAVAVGPVLRRADANRRGATALEKQSGFAREISPVSCRDFDLAGADGAPFGRTGRHDLVLATCRGGRRIQDSRRGCGGIIGRALGWPVVFCVLAGGEVSNLPEYPVGCSASWCDTELVCGEPLRWIVRTSKGFCYVRDIRFNSPAGFSWCGAVSRRARQWEWTRA